MTNEELMLKYRFSNQEGKLEIESIILDKNKNLVNKFLHSVLRKYTDDLFQEGMIGLLEAVRKFDTDRGVKFSTFAHNYVRLRTCRFLINDRMIRCPVGAYYQNKAVDVATVEDYTLECENSYEVDYTHIEAFNKCLEIMKTKNEQLEFIFIHRMVLGKSLEEVAKEIGITSEWVRQTEDKIRECLRKELEKLGYL